MAFPEAVARSILVKCGRCCCLCHRFCGSRIELHHIVQKASGGKDIEDNCIALCFECHADVGAYNPSHPKGRKYTSVELKEHRAAWFRKVASSPGLPADDEFRELDFKLFKRLWSWLGDASVQELLKNQDFGSAFHGQERKPLLEFRHWADRPEFEFFDADLEKMRVSLVKSSEKFLSKLGQFTGPIRAAPDAYRVPPEINHNYPRLWRRRVAVLNGRATRLFNEINEFARYARRKLRFDLEELEIELWPANKT